MSKKSKYFADLLKAARGNKSQAEFADFLGVVQQTYSRCENGKLPGTEILRTIALKLNTTVDGLLGPINWCGMEQGETVELHDLAPRTESDLEIWQGRAKRAEQELADLKADLRELIEPKIEEGSVRPKREKPSSDVPSGVKGAVEKAAEKLRREDPSS